MKAPTPPTAAERNAPKAVDLWKGMDCKGFDPERSDHVHGRAGAAPLLFDRMEGVKVFGCEACVYGERYEHTCGLAIEERVVARHARRRAVAAVAAGESMAAEMGGRFDLHILDKLRPGTEMKPRQMMIDGVLRRSPCL